MGYYQGDYYRGDYYRGDPFLGGLIPVIGGLAKSALSKIVGRRVPTIARTALATAAGTALARPGGIPLPGPFRVHPTAALPGGRPFITREAGSCPPGFHVNRRGTGCARNRRMNPANPRALRRAIRREQGFVALAKRTLKGTGITIGRRSFGTKKRRR